MMFAGLRSGWDKVGLLARGNFVCVQKNYFELDGVVVL